MGRVVVLASVERQDEYADRVVYHVTLSCGCQYWEHRQAAEHGPEPGRAAACFATHRPSDERARTLDPSANGVI